MSKGDLLKRLVSIHQTKEIIGRPSIYFEQTPSPDDILDVHRQSYLVLVPVTVPRSLPWPQPTRATFRYLNLLTINKLLADLAREMIQSRENNLSKKEIEFYKNKKEHLDNEEDELASEKKVLRDERAEIDKKEEEQYQRLLLLYGKEHSNIAQEQHNDHDTSAESTIPVPLIDRSTWQSHVVHHNIFSSDDDDDDEYMNYNQDSPVETNILLNTNKTVDERSSLLYKIETWLQRNDSWNATAIQNKSIDYDSCTDLEMTEAILNENTT